MPEGTELLVAGFSCVDFSHLNVKKRTLEEMGESGDTFRAIYHYVDRHRPKIIVIENVYGAPWPGLKEAFQKANYAAEFVKLDTKQYYIPHTRQRGYLVAIDKGKSTEANSPHSRKADSMAKCWVQLMEKLRRPASSSIEAFLLDEDDPRVRRAREELGRSGASDERAPREVDWVRCQGRHQTYRTDLGLGFKRPMTGWEDNGSCKVPDYAWTDWATQQVERIWDTLEISQLRNARRGFDSQYKT